MDGWTSSSVWMDPTNRWPRLVARSGCSALASLGSPSPPCWTTTPPSQASNGTQRDGALQNLEQHAQAVAEACNIRPDTVLLAGQPAEALQAHAHSNDYDVLVISRRGHGATKALLGSVATHVSREATMPVLLMGE